VIVEKGKIVGIELVRNEQDDNGEWNLSEDQITRIKANFVISAFGSTLGSPESTKSHPQLMFDAKLNIFQPRTL